MIDAHARVQASFDAQGLMTTLGASLAYVGDGEVHIHLPFSAALSQQHGYAHAGAITSVVDSACGYAALTRAPDGHEVVSVEFKVNFVRPALGRSFLAIGRAQTTGRTLSVCTGEVRALTDDGGQTTVALMQATMMYVRA